MQDDSAKKLESRFRRARLTTKAMTAEENERHWRETIDRHQKTLEEEIGNAIARGFSRESIDAIVAGVQAKQDWEAVIKAAGLFDLYIATVTVALAGKFALLSTECRERD